MVYLISVLIWISGFLNMTPDVKKEAGCKNSAYILSKSQEYHDPGKRWETSEFAVHIQEPRKLNRLRYSIVRMDNNNGSFFLERDSEAGTVRRLIDEAGTPEVLLNGSPDIPDDIREANRLDEQRNFGYRSFYQLMYGLPMSINGQELENLEDAELISFEGEQVYVIRMELEEAMISKKWELMVAADDYEMVALRFDQPDEEPDELILFDGSYIFNEINLPRFRHWYSFGQMEYRGSDIIVGELTE